MENLELITEEEPLHYVLNKLMNEYLDAKKVPFGNSPMIEFVTKTVRRLFGNLEFLNGYLINSSAGKGNWADVPWIAIMDKRITTTALEGVYIVYLMSADCSSIYLTLNQGCTNLKNKIGKKAAIDSLRSNAQRVIQKNQNTSFNYLDRPNLKTKSQTAELYEYGSIFYKRYLKGALPSEDVLQRDLKELIAIYKKYADFETGHSQSKEVDFGTLGKFYSWEVIDSNTAIKHCDKSFFEYNGSGVPQQIKWFFGLTGNVGGKTIITLIYDGNEYAGKIYADSYDSSNVQIYWDKSLGELLNKYRNFNAKAIFKRLKQNVYSISMESDLNEEQEAAGTTMGEGMTIKDITEKIKDYILAKGFNYEDGLIENFYLSLKAKPFVILAGTSGTGKTRLVKLFAEAIGATSSNGRYKMVAVRPDWSDSSDLFGHVDLNGRFIPGAIIDFVKDAMNDSLHPYILCFDEMNLARVEYYLSDILSIIETREFNGKAIVSDPLIDDTYYGADETAKTRYGKLMFPENLYIVGTVNMDETTFPFSRKVLDRANTIEFSFVDLIPKFDSFNTRSVEPLVLGNEFLKSNYLVLAQCIDRQDKVEEYCNIFQDINEKLKIANSHVGYRVRDEVVFYLLNNDEYNLISEDDAVDNMILQKILPRIQGGSVSIKNMLCELFKICAGDYEGYQIQDDNISDKMSKVLSSSNNVKYRKSAEKIELMIRRFEEDGFTSYWL